MKLVETVRSWSFPPAYTALPHDDNQPTPTQVARPKPRPNIIRATRPALSTYLLTFSKQWLLIHVFTIFLSFALMFTGAAVFVTRPLSFSNGDEVKFAWLSSATGMICAMVDGVAFGALRKLETADVGLTLEQQGTRGIVTTAVAVLGQLAVGTVTVAIGMAAPRSGDWMRFLKFIAFLAATLNAITCVYDIVKQSQSRHDSEDDWGPDDLDDELPRQVSDTHQRSTTNADDAQSGRTSGAIHL
ncbi:hypothetical protein LTR95_007942 [Oleoguttula sp. CCFEE 5521]